MFSNRFVVNMLDSLPVRKIKSLLFYAYIIRNFFVCPMQCVSFCSVLSVYCLPVGCFYLLFSLMSF